jgi:leucyl/phenylalanyl-tRNA--protein transferase
MTDPDGVTRWYTASPRGIIPLQPPQAFHVPSSLRQIIRQGKFTIRLNTCFAEVMRQCGQRRLGGTWIGKDILDAYQRLHELGFAHSVEAWRNGELAGGLYGVALGGAFFGESMFHLQRDASKVALVYLVDHLRQRGFTLLDSQATTEHLKKFGAIDIPVADYLGRLDHAIGLSCQFL